MSERTPLTLNPKTYVSPSGEYTVLVNPTQRSGAGPAHYRVKRGTTTLWEGKRAFTLWETRINDTGTVAGYAYADGYESSGPLVLVIVAPDGTLRRHEKILRQDSRIAHGSAFPFVRGIVLTQERFIVHLFGAPGNWSVSTWRTYSPTTGERLQDFPFPKDNTLTSPSELEAVAGTPLLLLHGESCFALLNPAGKIVWKLVRPGNDDTLSSEEELENWQRLEGPGGILAANSHGQFTLRFVAQKQRVTFSVVQDEMDWRVTESGREPYLPPTPPVVRFTGPSVTLTLRDSFELRSPGLTPLPPIRSLWQLIPAGPGCLAFLRDRKDLVVVSTKGTVLHTASLAGIPLPSNDQIGELIWRGETGFLIFVSHAESTQKSVTDAYPLDASTGQLGPRLRLRQDYIKATASLPSGGFVVSGSHTGSDALAAYGAQGKQLWEQTKEDSPESLTVLRDGTIAALYNGENTVQLLTQNGRLLKTISLKKTWGREPNYPSSLHATPDGGFLLHDFNGKPPLVWMDKHGKILRQTTPHNTEGAVLSYPKPAITPNGQLWVTDGYCLLRQSHHGQPLTLLGEPPDPRKLRKISDLIIHPDGRILAQDDRTHAAHLFDARGTWHMLYRLPASQEERDSGGWLEFGPNATLAIEDVWFDAQGKQIKKPAGFVPRAVRLRQLQRRPDGNWTDYFRHYLFPGAVAPDRSLALLDGGFICLYSANDTPLRQFPLPNTLPLGDYPRLAYDGSSIVVVGNKQLLCYSPKGEPRWQATLPFDDVLPFLTDSGKTLCLFQQERTVWRYAMLQ